MISHLFGTRDKDTVDASEEIAHKFLRKSEVLSDSLKLVLCDVTESEESDVNSLENSTTRDVYGLSSNIIKRTTRTNLIPLT